MEHDLLRIKKKYGEEMMHLCRKLFPTLLEEGILASLLESHFYPSHELYRDIVSHSLVSSFRDFINNFDKKPKKENIVSCLSPKDLLSKVGYDLYECKEESDIQKFKKYYAPGEELCTFKGNRLQSNYVFFAVKKNALYLKREDFLYPKRQDEYGTSVISIQFSKDANHTLSIKNRYNHHVNDPDATFSNYLDNITPGLTDSFEKTYGLVQKHINNAFELPGYVKAGDKRFYKYNYKINNIYYGTDNIIIDNFDVHKYPKEKFIIMDYFILDLQSKKIYLYDPNVHDAFHLSIPKINKIAIVNKNTLKIITMYTIGGIIEIILNKNNQIVFVYNECAVYIFDYFLYRNRTIQSIDLPNVEQVGDCFLYFNQSIRDVCMPKLRMKGKGFFYYLYNNHSSVFNINMDQDCLKKIRELRR